MQFAVLYGARANTGIDRMKIINAVAKSVPAPHKVDLSAPDKAIVVEIIKVWISLFLVVLRCVIRLISNAFTDFTRMPFPNLLVLYMIMASPQPPE